MSTKLASASLLKPEIRLAQAVSQFEADLTKEQKTVFRNYRSQSLSSPPVPSDVMQLTAEIDRQDGGRCVGPRFTNFLQVVQQFATLGDVVVGGTQNMIACSVWSLVRITFLSIRNYVSYLDRLSDLFLKVGRTAPRYQNMALLYPQSKALQSNLFEYFIVVVRLCHQLLKFTQKSIFSQSVSYLSDSDMETYRSDLDRWATSISAEITLIMANDMANEEARINSTYKSLSSLVSKEESHRRIVATKRHVLDFCSKYDYERPWKSTRKLGNTTLFRHAAKYQEWKSQVNSCTLMYMGKLGSGKSVLLANIVDDLNIHVQSKNTVVTYFFSRHDIPESLNARTVIGSLARQLLLPIADLTMAAEVIDETASAPDFEKILSLLHRALPSEYKAYFVLDGLDDWDYSERDMLAQQLQKLQETVVLHLCVSSRVEPSSALEMSFARVTTLKITSIPDDNPDIEMFVEAQLTSCLECGKLVVGDPGLILEIQDALLRGSHGIFLWIILSIEFLCATKSDEAIRDALVDYPRDISETFAQIRRMLGGSAMTYQRQILASITYAQRRLAMTKDVNEESAQTTIGQSDSGYASAPYGPYGSQKIPESIEDDSATIYTQQTDIDASSKTRYIHELADLIFHDLASESFDDRATLHIHSCLESLLKTFAVRLAYDGSERAGRSMVFIHRHRQAIAEALKSMSSQMDEHPELSPHIEPIDPIGKVMNWFTDKEDDRSFNEMPDQTEWGEREADQDIDDDFPEEEDIHEITEYRELIKNSEAYHWLISQLKCNIILSRQHPESQSRIRDHILNSFPGPLKISRKDLPEKFQAKFMLNWDPLKFLLEQYSEAPFSVFETAIALTGSFEEAQATTCRQYLEQTWPHMATTILRLIGGALKAGYGCPHEESSCDGTSLTINLSQDYTSMVVVGFRESVADVGEILAWLGSALRSSPEPEQIAICQAMIKSHRVTPIGSNSIRISREYQMDFQLISPDTAKGNGKCWFKMFRNPVIATGFPILSRTERNTGLELPLNMMARLGQAKYLTSFDRSIFLKGFSTMLFPTWQADGTIFWHLLYNEDRRRISYRDCRVHHHRNSSLENISYPEVERSRHVVGWSSAVKVYAGAVDGKYDIRRSGLKNSVSGAILEKVSLSVGKVANVGASFNIGVKDIPLHLRPEGTYRDQIRDAYSNYIIFYDTEDERAWLVNGATALLHVVRASIEEYRSPRHHISPVQALFASRYCFPPEEFLEASTPHTSTSAVEVLLAEHNRDLVVDRDKGAQRVEKTKREDGKIETVTKWDEKIFRFQDLVEQKLHILEQILDYQCNWGASGIEVKPPTRQHLKGFDFTDVATRTQDLSLKVTALKAGGKAWIDFARSIRAITLFGKGFGDVFKPSEQSNALCAHWAEIPKESSYLAICIADLIAISSQRGDPEAKPMRLVDDICWHKPDRLFDACKCKVNSSTKLTFGRRKVCDRVQVLLPASARFHRVNSPVSFLSALEGAVLFGHSKTFPWKWRDHGDPEEGAPEQDPVESDPQPSDSGLGSSLTSSELDSV